MALSKVNEPDSGLTMREIDGELVVLDTQSNRVHQLNRTASFVWRRSEGGDTPQAIASALAAEFDVGAQEALDDVVETLRKLRFLKLLVSG
jgi:hypothetical protein